jgi:hypothetical protein
MHLLRRDHRPGDFGKPILAEPEVNGIGFFSEGIMIAVGEKAHKRTLPWVFEDRGHREEDEKMKWNRLFICFLMVILFATSSVGCHPKIDTMSKAEKVFIKMVDRTASKLDLKEDQKIGLEKLKIDIHKNFQDGRTEKRESMLRIKEEGIKGSADIQKMTSLLQGSIKDESQRINRAFDLMLGFQKNLNEDQKKKLSQMISDWVAKWD